MMLLLLRLFFLHQTGSSARIISYACQSTCTAEGSEPAVGQAAWRSLSTDLLGVGQLWRHCQQHYQQQQQQLLPPAAPGGALLHRESTTLNRCQALSLPPAAVRMPPTVLHEVASSTTWGAVSST